MPYDAIDKGEPAPGFCNVRSGEERRKPDGFQIVHIDVDRLARWIGTKGAPQFMQRGKFQKS